MIIVKREIASHCAPSCARPGAASEHHLKDDCTDLLVRALLTLTFGHASRLVCHKQQKYPSRAGLHDRPPD